MFATAPVCLVMVADLSKFGGEVLMPAPGCRYCFPEYILVLFRHRISDSPQSLYGSGKIEEWFEIERYSTAFDQSSGGICKMIKEKLL